MQGMKPLGMCNFVSETCPSIHWCSFDKAWFFKRTHIFFKVCNISSNEIAILWVYSVVGLTHLAKQEDYPALANEMIATITPMLSKT